jgi:hypothetical protein
MNTETGKCKQGEQEHRQAPPLRLPGFIVDEEIGFGDILKRATTALGVQPCAGCVRRAAALNRWLVFTGKSRKSQLA